MESKEIITRIKHQLEDGFIDFNETDDIEEMNYVREAIYKLTLYEKALDITLSKLADCKICHQASIDHVPDCKDYKSCKECWNDWVLKEGEKQ